MARIGNEALQRQRAAAVYINLATRRTIERTYQSVARAVADGLIGDKRALAVFRACDGRVKMLDLQLEVREQLLAQAEGA